MDVAPYFLNKVTRGFVLSVYVHTTGLRHSPAVEMSCGFCVSAMYVLNSRQIPEAPTVW